MATKEALERIKELFGEEPYIWGKARKEPSILALGKTAAEGSKLAERILERSEQEKVPEQIIRHVQVVRCCEKCGSEDIAYRIIFNKPNNIIVRVVCMDCHYSRSLPHSENLQKRTNTTLTHWRDQVLKRDDYKCRICRGEENLEAHHIIPVSADKEQKYKYDINNGITLCREHHMMVHPWMKSPKKEECL